MRVLTEREPTASSRFLPAWAILTLAAATQPAQAQVVVNPNQIVGSFRFTNVNPVLRDYIGRRANGGRFHLSSDATSVDLDSELTSSSSGSDSNREFPAYEISVETHADGYRYSVEGRIYDSNRDSYTFATAVSPPVFPEPADDAILDFAECAGGIRLLVPEGVVSGFATASLGRGHDLPQARRDFAPLPADEFLMLVRGDETFSVDVRFQTGTDRFVDLLIWKLGFRGVEVPCDTIVELDCRSGPNEREPIELGLIRGRFDVLGEYELPYDSGFRWLSLVQAAAGPWGNSRSDRILSSPASGSYQLGALMPSTVTALSNTYLVQAVAMLRGGHSFRSPSIEVEVGNGAVIDLGDALVFDPGRTVGDIRLAGPPNEEPLGSPLAWLRRSNPLDDPDIIPPETRLTRSHVFGRGVTSLAPGTTRDTSGAMFQCDTRGTYLPELTAWLGDYELLTGALDRQAGNFDLGGMRLEFSNMQDPTRADSWLDTDVSIDDRSLGTHAIAPGDRLSLDRGYCFGQVTVSFEVRAGTLFAPAVTVIGGFEGQDHEGHVSDYDLVALGRGTPPPETAPAATGQVILALPMGTHEVTPSLVHVSDTGQNSTLRLPPIPLTVGCRQRIDLRPEIALSIGIDDLPACTEAGNIELTGRVVSEEVVTSITVSVNGGSPQTLCSNCGADPSFSGSVGIVDGGNELLVTATDATGREATVSAFSRHAAEPSALDRRPGSQPVRVALDAGALRLSWEDRGPANLYAGSLDTLWATGTYDHAGLGACGVGEGDTVVAAEDGSRYFLVTTPCSWGDGSLGRDSFGRERASAVDRCR